MQEAIFDFDRIGTTADFYQIAVQQLNLPEYFGNNLDALYDALTGMIGLPLLVRFINLSMGQLEKFDAIIAVFEEAAAALDEQLVFEYYLKKP
ncbi:barstar family protein [Niabella beijingensis]|uniref:barstar family protein n=1 Tax=Niabella beijingensis TaxID=2872700 RepID=UPI001CBAACED|nr:barstar family protein [Niabella beijingensis]MBZ4190101.1 barstar family protein [Niabella beijingensis]